MSDLEPCPFCGDTPIDVCENTDGNRIWYSVLSSCGNEVCNTTPDKVESDWNTRPIEDSLRLTISTLETAFNEARREVREAESKTDEMRTRWRDAEDDFKRVRIEGEKEQALRIALEKQKAELQAEVERLRCCGNCLFYRTYYENHECMRNGGDTIKHGNGDFVRYSREPCPHWQPKEGGE
jgi:hypothetical protein